MKKFWSGSLLTALLLLNFQSFAQQALPGGATLTGNFEITSQYYQPDSAIKAPEVPEKFLNNSFMLLNLTWGKFRAGMRFESYQNPLLGFSTLYTGSGIPYRFAAFTTENLDVTAGNFYEQFGNGLVLRSYEERQLGIDNAIDGVRAIYSPAAGVRIKGLIGYQRYYWEKGPGIVRGADAEVQLNDAIPAMTDNKTRITLGGSVVSKYQKDEDPLYNLPENVASFAGRTTITYGRLSFDGEYAYKYNDPSDDNGYIYKPGQAIYLNGSYNRKGLGMRLTAKWIDNMSFRSDRNAKLNDLSINYLPAISKQYTYRLSTLYPYATQPNGESAYSAEVYYLLKPNTPLGGKYGTNISVNGSTTTSIDKSPASNDTLGYETGFMSRGDNVYYQDFNLEINRKISKKSKIILSYVYQVYDKVIIEQEEGSQVTAHIGIADYTYKITNKNSIRFELQHLWTEQDRQNWAMGLVEYSVSPNWSFAIFDEYNYGNDIPDQQFHFYNFSGAFTKGGTRISASYVRQRAGLLCVGGVCRLVPASNGVNLTITSRF